MTCPDRAHGGWPARLVAVLVALQPDARSVPLGVFPAMAGTALIGVVAGTWR